MREKWLFLSALTRLHAASNEFNGEIRAHPRVAVVRDLCSTCGSDDDPASEEWFFGEGNLAQPSRQLLLPSFDICQQENLHSGTMRFPLTTAYPAMETAASARGQGSGILQRRVICAGSYFFFHGKSGIVH